MHRHLTGQLEIMHPALQIVARGAHVAQLLRFHHLIVFRRGLDGGLCGGDVLGVDLFQLGLAGGDIKRKLVIKGEGLFIEHIKRFDILEQGVLVAQKVIGDPVDLTLHLFKARGELGKRRGPPQQLFPPAALAAHIKFAHGKAADRGDDPAQAVACRADILVAHALKHRLADFLQFRLRGGAERDDRVGVAHVDLGHAAGDLGADRGIGLVQRHNRVGLCGFGKDGAAYGLNIGKGGLGFLTDGV